MVQANELRVGNILRGASRGLEVVVSGRMIAQFEEGVMNLHPIKLTPEILEKCGFEHTQSQWYSIKYFTDCDIAAEVMLIKYNLTSGRCGINDTDTEGGSVAMVGKSFKSLHELQNTYRWITGTELAYAP